MEPRAHHVLIGLFSLLAFAAALGFALWLNSTSSDREYQDYEVIFNEEVSGLSPGSAVQYSGIKIGDVLELALDPADPRKVLAHIRVAADTPIKQDTRARLSITGITGSALIQLYSGTPQSPLLISQGGPRPQIIADRSPLARLLANGEDWLLGISALLERANQLLSDENLASISRTLGHIEQASAALAAQRDELGSTLQQVSRASQDASTVLRTANGLLDNQGRASLDQAKRLLASLERSSNRVEQLLNDNHEALDGGLQGLGELGPTLIELRETLSALRTFSQRVEQNPAGYLLRSENIKEFQP